MDFDDLIVNVSSVVGGMDVAPPPSLWRKDSSVVDEDATMGADKSWLVTTDLKEMST